MARRRLIRTNDDGVCNLQLSEPEIEALLVVLNLAKTAASVLAHQEMTKGLGQAGATKMNKMASDANELMRIITDSVYIGEPKTDELN